MPSLGRKAAKNTGTIGTQPGLIHNSHAKWKIPEGHYDYNRMKVLLIEGKGGNIDPYNEVLKRVGMVNRPEVEVIKIRDKPQYNNLSYHVRQISEAIDKNFALTGKKTLLHCYISAE